jgi:hypothetical protein
MNQKTSDNNIEDLQPLFDLLRQVPPPDELKQAAARQSFLVYARKLRRELPVSQGWFVRVRGWINTQKDFFLSKNTTSRRLKMVSIIITIVLAIAVATGGVAYASDSAAPGDLLYSVDRAIEQIQLSLTTDTESALQLQLEFAQERLQEIEVLASQGDFDNMSVALEEYGKTISSIAQTVGSPDGVDKDTLIDLLDTAFSIQQTQLEEMLDQLPDQEKEPVEEKLSELENDREEALEAIEKNLPDADEDGHGEDAKTPEASETPEPTEMPETPEDQEEAVSTETMEASETPKPSETHEVNESPEASKTHEEDETPEATETPEVEITDEASETPKHTETPEMSETPEPNETPEASETPESNQSSEEHEDEDALLVPSIEVCYIVLPPQAITYVL